MVDCLRTKSVEELLKVENTNKRREAFDTSLGPIIDGLAVPSDPRLLMASPNDTLPHRLDPIYHSHAISRQLGQLAKRPHHLLFGITRIESPFLFTDQEERTGIDSERRDHILRALVKNVVDYYQEVSCLLLSISLFVLSPFFSKMREIRAMIPIAQPKSC